ncbi:hypothetical protein [Streptomyces lavendulae]|uniref:hypothetical protein n=1 Tax=Streptomyces lavendulae TaxID=1914 RepID=UPI0024A58A21|nr:hypothetical protein [Streptomyces lavendulae]GLW04053.1 hypothetical protein Slala05_76830 [Streptomyces lavendulae subsp. lavendulae]
MPHQETDRVSVPFRLTGCYRIPGWQDWTADYESRIGAALARSPQVVAAARKTLSRLFDVLWQDCALRDPGLTGDEIGRRVVSAFFLDDLTSAGQTGIEDFERRMERITFLRSEPSPQDVERGDWSLREVMTAIYNAAYFRSAVLATRGDGTAANSSPDEGEVSFKALVHRLWLSTDTPRRERARQARALGLNTRHLDPYAYFLGADSKLLAQRLASASTPVGYNFARDVYALGCMSFYSGVGDELEIAQSQRARQARVDSSSAERRHNRAHWERLGLPLSAAERAFLATDEDSFLTLEGFDVEEYPVGQVLKDAFGHPDEEATREKLKQEKGVLDVQFHHDYGSPRDAVSGQYPLTKVVKVLARQVVAHRYRRGDLSDTTLCGPEFPLSWMSGWAYYDIDPGSHWYRSVTAKGFPVATGVSGTTARMLATFGWLNVPGCRARDFLYALMGWMLPARDHSLYEIVRGAQMALLTRGHERNEVGPEGFAMRQRTLLGPDHRAEEEFLAGLTTTDDVMRAYRTFHDLCLRETLRPADAARLSPDSLPYEFYIGRVEANELHEADPPQLREARDVLDSFRKISEHRSMAEADRQGDPEVARSLTWLFGSDARISGERDLAAQWKLVQDAARRMVDRIHPAHLVAVGVYTTDSHQAINFLLEFDQRVPGPITSWVDAPTHMALRRWFKALVRAHADTEMSNASNPDLPYLLTRGDICEEAYSALNNALQEWRWARAGEGKAEKLRSVHERTEDFCRVIDRLPMDTVVAELKTHVDLSYEALERLPGYVGRTHRGDWALSGGKGFLDAIGAVFGTYGRPGSKITFTTLTSSTPHRGKAVDFAKKNASRKATHGKPVLLNLDLAEGDGCFIDRFSQAIGEKEVLIKPGTRFRVTAREPHRAYPNRDELIEEIDLAPDAPRPGAWSLLSFVGTR